MQHLMSGKAQLIAGIIQLSSGSTLSRRMNNLRTGVSGREEHLHDNGRGQSAELEEDGRKLSFLWSSEFYMRVLTRKRAVRNTATIRFRFQTAHALSIIITDQLF